MKKRILSLVLILMMVITSIPLNTYADGQSEAYTAEQLVKQGNTFYNTTKRNDSNWSPSSLTAFTIKAAGLGDSIMPDDSSYKYFSGTHQRLKASAEKNFSLLGLIDKIYDQMAIEVEDSEIKANVIELLNKQRSDGTFCDNALEHAKSILVLDAYYGLDYDEEWIDCQQGEGYGRIGAVKALLNTSGSSNLWNKSNNSYVGAFLNLSIVPALATYGFQSTNNKTSMSAFPLMALSNYAEHPQIGQDVRNTISNTMVSIESAFTGTTNLATYNDAINIIPALIALDGIEINAEYLQKLGGKFTGKENNIINALELIETYKLLYGLTYQGTNKLPQEDGSFNLDNKYNTEASEYFTQMAVIAGSDILSGETAYKKIMGSRAKALGKIKETIENISIPTIVEVNLESIQAGNDTANIDLPRQGLNGAIIAWESSNTSVIYNDGLVTFPEIIPETVTLTATISLNYDNNKVLEKTKKFTIEVESKVTGEAGQLLSERFAYINNIYGNDISSLGWEGAITLAEIGQDLSNYEICELSEGNSPEDYARNIIQLVVTGKNPYDYNSTNYVTKLKNIESKYNGNPLVLIALGAVGEKLSDKFVSDVMAKTVTGSSVEVHSLAVNALTLHGDNDITSSSAITTTSSAISLNVIADNYINFVQTIQRENGMFGDSLSDHAQVISALAALGDDLFSSIYVKGTNTILEPVKNSDKFDLNSIRILSNILSAENLWQRIQLTTDKFEALIKSAESILEMGEGKYSPNTLHVLETALGEAKKAQDDSYQESYYILKDAIKGLSTSMLPEFTDLNSYTEHSILGFKNAVENLYNFLKTEKTSISRAKDYAQEVVDSYGGLVLKSKLLNSTYELINVLPVTPMSTYGTGAMFMSIKEELTSMQIEAARILEKTSKAYNEYYGFDVSTKGYWGVFEVAAMGKDVSKYKVYDVTNHKNGLLSIYQATDFAAIILQLVLTGENPYDYNGINYVDHLKHQEQMENGQGNGNFGPYANNIWTLIALGSVGEYNEKLIKTVTGMAKKGQWVDTEAWALSAIQNYKDEISEADMELVINNFHDKMISASSQKDDWTIGNAFTHGCFISGLVAAGEDITSPKWTSKGLNILTSLEKNLQTDDGRFSIGDNFEPAFVKDAVIALGDAAQGSNVWQRTYLDETKLNKAISEGEEALANASDQVPDYKKKELESSLRTAKEIIQIKGNGHKYFRLLDAIKNLDEIELPEFAEKQSYTEDSFLQFENAVKNAALILMRTKAEASVLNTACKEILTAYDNLKKEVDNPTNPGTGKKITVTFKLLGATKHEGNGTIQTLKSGNLKTWIQKTNVTVSEGSKVYDIFTNVLDEKGYGYIGADDNYVRYITTPNGETLGEFDNGQNSGWMYTVNGKHPAVGLRSYTLKDGDDIVWHYTDDYTIEQDSVKWNDNTVAVSNDDNAVNIKTVATAVNGSATANVTAKDIAAAIEQARANSNVAIKITPEGVGSAFKLTVGIPKTSLNDISKEKLDLKIETPIGNISIPNDALEKLLQQAEGSKIEIIIENVKKENLTEGQKSAVGSHVIYDISIMCNGKKISSFGGKEITISLSYTLKEGQIEDKVTVWYLNDEGKLEQISCKYNEKTSLATFVTNHLSYYIVGYDDSISFIDVNIDDWFYESVMYAVQKELLTGTSETNFSPNSPVTRAMLVTVLHRLEDKPVSAVAKQFTDVSDGEWYTEAVKWSSEKDIVKGITEIEFKPQNNITREQLAVMLYRYVKVKNLDTEVKGNIEAFVDKEKISSYAEEAIKWSVGKCLISGKGNGTLDPSGNATRAEVSAILQRFVENIK